MNRSSSYRLRMLALALLMVYTCGCGAFAPWRANNTAHPTVAPIPLPVTTPYTTMSLYDLAGRPDSPMLEPLKPPPQKTPASAYDYANWSDTIFNDKYIFYLWWNDSPWDKTKLIRIDADGSNKTVLYEKSGARLVTPFWYKEWLYFFVIDSDEYSALYKMREDGTECQLVRPLNEGYEPSGTFIADDKMYYREFYFGKMPGNEGKQGITERAGLYRFDLYNPDEEAQMVLKGSINGDLTTDGHHIVGSSYIENMINYFVLPLDGGEIRWLDRAYRMSDMRFIDGWLYYNDYHENRFGDFTYRCYRMTADGTITEFLGFFELRRGYDVYDGYIYNGAYRDRLHSGGDCDAMVSYEVEEMCEEDDARISYTVANDKVIALVKIRDNTYTESHEFHIYSTSLWIQDLDGGNKLLLDYHEVDDEG